MIIMINNVVFVGHGSPMNAIEDNVFSNSWKNLQNKLIKPKMILAISAHWFKWTICKNKRK